MGRALLPHLELNALYDAINFDVPVEHLANNTVRTTRLSVFVCPSDRNVGLFTVADSSGNPTSSLRPPIVTLGVSVVI